MAGQRQTTGLKVNMPLRQCMTEEEFIAWCDEDIKAEWVGGELTVHEPANVRHVDLAGFLNFILRGYVTSKSLGVVYGPELQVHFVSLQHRRVPDLLFVSTGRLHIIMATEVEGAPDLIIEIVSPDSSARDWRDKYLEYEATGVREYWVIDPIAERLETYVLGADARYTRL